MPEIELPDEQGNQYSRVVSRLLGLAGLRVIRPNIKFKRRIVERQHPQPNLRKDSKDDNRQA